ncbi:MAG: hypothetical protein OXG69_14925 [bacterium]|nr:hypothetical protein [bacterium]
MDPYNASKSPTISLRAIGAVVAGIVLLAAAQLLMLSFEIDPPLSRGAVDDLTEWVRGSPSTGTGLFAGIALVLLALGGLWQLVRTFGTGGRVLTTRRRRGWTKLDRITLEDAIERRLEAIDRRSDVRVRITRRGQVNVRLVTPDPSAVGPVQELRDAVDEQCAARALPCRSGRITATVPRRMTRRRRVR